MSTSASLTYEFPSLSPREKLKDLILYITRKMENDPAAGRTKLAKVLYFADIESYRRYREPVSGTAYARADHGPVPEGYLDVLTEMEGAGQIQTDCRPFYGRTQYHLRALAEANLDKLSGRDVSVVDEVIEKVWHLNASEISKITHNYVWQNMENGEQIPYEACLLSDDPPTSDEIEIGKQLADEYRNSARIRV